MTPREIIAQAWAITTREKSLRRWGFVSAFFETLLNAKLIGYQLYFAYSFLEGKEAGVFDDFVWLHENVPFGWFIGILIAFAFLLLLEFLLPHFCNGAIIGLAAKSYRGEPVKGGLVLALHNFFSIFAVHEIFVLHRWPTVTSAISLMLRYITGSVKWAGIIGLIAIFCISNVLKLFAGFAEEAVVIKKAGIGKGIAQSYKMLISNLSHIFFIVILMFVISLRILINVITLLLIPAIVIGVGLGLALFLSPALSYLIAGILGFVLIIAASYFFAYLHVFKQTVWTITYLQLNEQRDLDLILATQADAEAQMAEHA